jgi:hypothetical protein
MERAMGLQFDSVTTIPDCSLTFILDDIMARTDRRGRQTQVASDDLESWLNALMRQATPLVSSTSGRASLEAWLDAVDAETAALPA